MTLTFADNHSGLTVYQALRGDLYLNRIMKWTQCSLLNSEMKHISMHPSCCSPGTAHASPCYAPNPKHQRMGKTPSSMWRSQMCPS